MWCRRSPSSSTTPGGACSATRVGVCLWKRPKRLAAEHLHRVRTPCPSSPFTSFGGPASDPGSGGGQSSSSLSGRRLRGPRSRRSTRACPSVASTPRWDSSRPPLPTTRQERSQAGRTESAGTVGHAIPGLALRVVDEAGHPVGPDGRVARLEVLRPDGLDWTPTATNAAGSTATVSSRSTRPVRLPRLESAAAYLPERAAASLPDFGAGLASSGPAALSSLVVAVVVAVAGVPVGVAVVVGVRHRRSDFAALALGLVAVLRGSSSWGRPWLGGGGQQLWPRRGSS